MRHRRRHAHAPPLRRRAVRLTAQQQIDARRAPTPTAFCMRPATATLGIRVTASVTLRELYGAHGAGIRAIAPRSNHGPDYPKTQVQLSKSPVGVNHSRKRSIYIIYIPESFQNR